MNWPARVVVAATVCLCIAVQLYVLFSGLFTTFLTNLPWMFLYMAIGTALSAAWLVLIAWFGWSGVTDRRYRVRMIVGDCVLSLLFAALWLLPALGVPICIVLFAVSDWLVVIIMTDAVERWGMFRNASAPSPPSRG
jgi:hypothetical protein